MSYTPFSSLGWVFFSKEDEEKAMKILDMMDSGTVDELGVGAVRNALSDAMFPGITTIMTRAKYFFIVPRILHSYIHDYKGKIEANEYLRQEQNELMMRLANEVDYAEKKGIIGISVAKYNKDLHKSRHKELMRKPSAIYWNGIKSYGIYSGGYSLANLLDTINLRKKHSTDMLTYRPMDGETKDDKSNHEDNSYIFDLPDRSKNWKENIKIELTPTEADFLKNKIIDYFPDTLLAHILKNKEAGSQFMKGKSFEQMCEMPFFNNLSVQNQRIVLTARNFWTLLYGAHIRYNIILHKRHGSESKLGELYEKWDSWKVQLKQFDWNQFDITYLWDIVQRENVRVNPKTKAFINQWVESIRNNDFDLKILESLVEKQESANKGSRSKLKLENDEKYKDWVGIESMEYRFSKTKTIVEDILSILK